MRILLLGGGGREHALSWKLTQSPACQKLYISPGNAGTAKHGQNISIDWKDTKTLIDWLVKNEIGMLIVGPEAPLVDGLTDRLRRHDALKEMIIIGPGSEGAQLEGSKAWAKSFMLRHNIPTARYRAFTQDTLEVGLEYLSQENSPYVLKADGLAAGKGVLILDDLQDAKKELREMLSGKFGQASNQVVIEQFLAGIEFSVFALTNGKEYCLLPVAKDYKRIGEGDTGLNTGGMGAVSPVSFVNDQLLDKVRQSIVQPTIQGLANEGIDYTGVIFFGLILVEGEPYVIEYNCRFGDPETQVIMPRLDHDLVELFQATHQGKLSAVQPKISTQTATAIILASGGYPLSYDKGKEIQLPQSSDALIFHAGTRKNDIGMLFTDGGRVIAVVGMADTISEARSKALVTADEVKFDEKYFRRDIGLDLL